MASIRVDRSSELSVLLQSLLGDAVTVDAVALYMLCCRALMGHTSPYAWARLRIYFGQVGIPGKRLLPPICEFKVASSLGCDGVPLHLLSKWTCLIAYNNPSQLFFLFSSEKNARTHRTTCNNQSTLFNLVKPTQKQLLKRVSPQIKIEKHNKHQKTSGKTQNKSSIQKKPAIT